MAKNSRQEGVDDEAVGDQRQKKPQQKASRNINDQGTIGEGSAVALGYPTGDDVTCVGAKEAANANQQIRHAEYLGGVAGTQYRRNREPEPS